ncbi:aldehyde dehydrogenase family 3 member B1 [Gonapodya prolifera JEL478]|uniref:Aldehyde dehydrogenase family 3 member B1 n=1 Tax=Gonapodya prolifera (strain JEL478) TaxID=1344416 RepID=A0A139B0D8_GONPJ|nr:aldehyde dehydrogenase family 3 member B1 [Gonapodya prolifera JEL478]|eukprot:KXS22462.1 aldehyde dehydrogenase family 3 member B1 [Gonapodya prolifera JEL478]
MISPPPEYYSSGTTFPSTPVDKFDKIVATARATFLSGRTRSLSWRKEQLRALYRMLDENSDAIIQAVQRDFGKPTTEAFMVEVILNLNHIVYCLKNIDKWTKPDHPEKGLMELGADLSIRHEPYGVSLIIAPWNYPWALIVKPLTCALTAGNVAICKPSELTPNCAALMGELFPKYLDRDAIFLVNGGVKQTVALLEKRFDHITFTGSTAVGKIIMAAATRHLTPVILELGGKSPVVIDPELSPADIARAGTRIVATKFFNSGQTCIAPDYILCPPHLLEPLAVAMREAVVRFYGQDPSSSPDLSRIVNRNHTRRIGMLIDQQKEEEGSVVVVGGNWDENKCFIEPTIIAGVDAYGPLMSQEIFGPVLPILESQSLNEAIDFIRERERPLALYIFTKNKATAEKIHGAAISGSVVINDATLQYGADSAPFGGVGHSGMGCLHGKYGFLSFSHQKTVLHKPLDWISEQIFENTGRYPPYTSKGLSRLETLIKQSLPCIFMSFCSDKWGQVFLHDKSITQPPERVTNRLFIMPTYPQFSSTPIEVFDQIISTARATFLSGRTREVQWRKEQLRALYRLIDENSTEIVEAVQRDFNKPTNEAFMAEVVFNLNHIALCIRNLDKWARPEGVEKGIMEFGAELTVRHEPLGICLIVAPWNYPFDLIFKPLTTALAAGNVAVCKPSELTENCAALLTELIPKYLDNEAVFVVNGGVRETTALLEKRFDHITFTGSTLVGKVRLHSFLSGIFTIYDVVLSELGGKSPVVIDPALPHADLVRTATRLVATKFWNSGQTCIAPDYVLCPPQLVESLGKAMRDAVERFYTTEPEASPDLARMVNRNHTRRIGSLIEQQKAVPGTVVVIGGTWDEARRFIEPTIIAGVKPDGPLMMQELFGPVLPILECPGIDDAISFIRQGERPLSLYIFTKSRSVAEKIHGAALSGTVVINDAIMQYVSDAAPFGGVGNSGMGSLHGKYGFLAYSHRKTVLHKPLDWISEQINENTGRYPPYTEKGLSRMQTLVKQKCP